MAYMEQLQAGLRSIGQAIEAGRRELKGTIDPLDQAIGELQDASGQLEKLLGLPPGSPHVRRRYPLWARRAPVWGAERSARGPPWCGWSLDRLAGPRSLSSS